MQVRIRVIEQHDGTFDLFTDRGHRIGGRLLSVPPKKNESMPVVPDSPFTVKHEAYAAAMHWNMYLAHAWKHRSKSKDRCRE